MLRRGKYFRRKDQHTVLWSKKPQRESRGTFCKEFEKKCFFYKDCHSKIYPFKMSHFETKVRVVQFWDQFNKTFTNVFFNCNYCFQILKQ